MYGRVLRKRAGRSICTIVAALFISVYLVPVFGTAEGLPSAPDRSQLVRVHLTRLGLTDRLDVTLTAPYLLTTSDDTQLYFQSGSDLSFLLKNEGIYLYYQGMSLNAGTQLTLARSAVLTDEKTGFCVTNYPTLYMGDLTLDVHEQKLRPVLTIHVEDYLLGVVPYEMGESFPVEALKAQAVAARTYAIRSQSPGEAYDLVDNTNDQVFRGYTPGNTNSELAVKETRGVCGFHKGKLAQCYYSASNGGQMELVESVWQRDGDYSYYTFGEDPYDVENPLSVVRSFEIPKIPGAEAPYELRKLMADELGSLLQAQGFDPAPESIRIDSVANVLVDTPAGKDSKLMTMLRLTADVSGRTRRDVSITLVDSDQEEVTLFLSDVPTAQLAPSDTPAAAYTPVVTTAPSAPPQPLYGPFVALGEPVSISVPIFPTAESAFGMNILGHYDNEIWTVSETESSFVLEARRYGHGVGMSQRGAQWMAATYGKNYQEILSFYYPGMQLMQYAEQPSNVVLQDAQLAQTAGPAPSPTPRPTLMPVTIDALEGQWYAYVTEISDNSSLNLRSEPSLNGDILMRLYKQQKLLVVERCPQEGWVRVQTDAIEGYVMESYLTAAE